MEIIGDISCETLARLRVPATRDAAFDDLADSLLRPFYWHARRLVVVHEDAEDVVQEALIHAYNHIDSFRGDHTELKSWFYRITTNVALSLLRRRKRNLFTSLDDVSRELAGRVAANSVDESEALLVRFQQEVLALPLKQRLVFNLRYYDEMPYRQIAGVLGQSEQTLKVNYHYAVEKLKQKLTEL